MGKLHGGNWAPEVRTAINDLLECYGVDGADYDPSSYVIFDFDNTTTIFDAEDLMGIYQFQHMAFAFSPDDIPEMLATYLPEPDTDLTEWGFGKGSYRDWLLDIQDAYRYLYDNYGPFTAAGLPEENMARIQRDPMWWEFTVKMMALFDLINQRESAQIAYPWFVCRFTGMTGQEVYDLTCAAFRHYTPVESGRITWYSPRELSTRVGPVASAWDVGIQVADEIRQAMRAFHESGIRVWVCSASATDVVRAGIDVWGLHEYVTGLLGMTPQQDADTVYGREYDYEGGCGWLCQPNGVWQRDCLPLKAQTQGFGKVTAIENTLCRRYGHGPLAFFMDSTGDFNACTEFASLKLVVCINRGDRSVCDGAGLIAALAIYQRDTLKYDLQAANAAGDTLYVLQGRDETGLRSFRSSNMTLRYGANKPQLFRDHDNHAQLACMVRRDMTTAQVLNTFSMARQADDHRNLLGIPYGFLSTYHGYHSRG